MNILPSADREFEKIRKIFFTECISKIKSNLPQISIINDNMRGKADILTKAFQIESISSYLMQINNENEKYYLEKIFRYICGSKYKKCLCYAECYNEFGEKKFNKKIYYFSIDISKYIFGFTSNAVPSKFPCINSYISHDIPKEILIRTNIMTTSLIISELVPNFSASSISLFNSILDIYLDYHDSHDSIKTFIHKIFYE